MIAQSLNAETGAGVPCIVRLWRDSDGEDPSVAPCSRLLSEWCNAPSLPRLTLDAISGNLVKVPADTCNDSQGQGCHP